MPIKFCVYGEGSYDYGVLEYGSGCLIYDGCYASYTKKASGFNHFKCVGAGEFPLGLFDGIKRKRGSKLNGFRRHAYYSAREASNNDADWLIIGTDADKPGKEGIERLDRYREEFEDGFKIAAEEDSSIKKISLIVLVPLTKIESWLLADERAFKKASGIDRGRLPKKPEELHGETNPKDILEKILEKHSKKTSVFLYSDIAKHASPATLRKRCSCSYIPFADSIPV